MTDPDNQIQQLTAKAAKVQTLLTQAETKVESITEQIAEIDARMAEMNVTPENAEDKMAKLIEKRDKEIAKAQAAYDGLDI